MIKAVLFDMDGVLIDSHDAWFYVFNKTLQRFENRKISEEEFDEVVWSKAFDEVAKQYFKVSLEEIRDYYMEIYEDYRKRLKVIDGVEKGLSMLKKKGIRLAVVSNTQSRVVQKVLEDVGVAEYFDLFVGGDDVDNGKPEPDILYKGLELLNLDKEDVLFVGDTIFDKMAAEKAGIRFVGFGIDGDHRIKEISGLLDLI